MVDGYEKGVSLVRWSLKKAYLTWVPEYVAGLKEAGWSGPLTAECGRRG